MPLLASFDWALLTKPTDRGDLLGVRRHLMGCRVPHLNIAGHLATWPAARWLSSGTFPTLDGSRRAVINPSGRTACRCTGTPLLPGSGIAGVVSRSRVGRRITPVTSLVVTLVCDRAQMKAAPLAARARAHMERNGLGADHSGRRRFGHSGPAAGPASGADQWNHHPFHRGDPAGE